VITLSWKPETTFPELAEGLINEFERQALTKEDILFAFMAIRSAASRIGLDVAGDEEEPPTPARPEDAPPLPHGDASTVLLKAAEITMSAVGIVQNQTDWLHERQEITSQAIEAINADLDLIANAVVQLGGALPAR